MDFNFECGTLAGGCDCDSPSTPVGTQSPGAETSITDISNALSGAGCIPCTGLVGDWVVPLRPFRVTSIPWTTTSPDMVAISISEAIERS